MKIEFFDEAGINSPDAGIRLYGHAPVAGEGCVEVERKLERKENPNTTLSGGARGGQVGGEMPHQIIFCPPIMHPPPHFLIISVETISR